MKKYCLLRPKILRLSLGVLFVAEILNKNPSKEIDYKGIESGKMKTARHLFETITSVLGDTIQQALSVNTSFYDIGGNSLNCIQTITKLRERGYFISE